MTNVVQYNASNWWAVQSATKTSHKKVSEVLKQLEMVLQQPVGPILRAEDARLLGKPPPTAPGIKANPTAGSPGASLLWVGMEVQSGSVSVCQGLWTTTLIVTPVSPRVETALCLH